MDQLKSRINPVNDDYPACERTLAELRIYPGETNPDEVSSMLRIQPTEMVAKGDSSTNSIGRTRTARHNCWFLSSEQFVESKDVRRHLDWLLDRLEPATDGLRRLQGTEGVRMTVTCIWWSRSGDGGPTLWPEQMSRLANLNLECGFDVAFYGFVDAEPEVQST